MMRAVLIICLFAPQLVQTQMQSGIPFESVTNFQQMLKKAEQTEKLIFVDCYATWCLPCKKMDKEVYSDDRVGEYFMQKFISCKIQMDTAAGDAQVVRGWYKDAAQIMKEYRVNSFPTYLFFSSQGRLLHRAEGLKSADELIALAQEALDPKRQVYTRFDNYKIDTNDFSRLPELATLASEYKDATVARDIARTYIDKYLAKRPTEEILSKENLDFLMRFLSLIQPGDKMFSTFKNSASQVDSVLNYSGLASNIVEDILLVNKIVPHLDSIGLSGVPDWKQMFDGLIPEAGELASERIILKAKRDWYWKKKDWKNFATSLVQLVDKFGVDRQLEGALLNDNAYYIFLYSDNTAELNSALAWSNRSISLDELKGGSNYATKLDTKANLLYKLGKREQAIVIQQQALKIDSENGEIKANLSKMKKKQSTWDHNQL